MSRGKGFAAEASPGSLYAGRATVTESNYHHGDLKQALVRAAREILRGEGADALSLRAIAAAVGVSHMAPYAHFKNKKELLQAVAASGFDELTERMLKAKSRTTRDRDLALNYGIEYMGFAMENPEFYRIMLSQVDPAGRRKRPADGGKEAAAKKGVEKKTTSEELRVSAGRPFKLLHGAFMKRGKDKKIALARALGAWSIVHGMAALLIDGHIVVPEGMEMTDLFKAAVGRMR